MSRKSYVPLSRYYDDPNELSHKQPSVQPRSVTERVIKALEALDKMADPNEDVRGESQDEGDPAAGVQE